MVPEIDRSVTAGLELTYAIEPPDYVAPLLIHHGDTADRGITLQEVFAGLMQATCSLELRDGFV